MVTKDDVLILVSWSGETEEFRPVIEYDKRFSIPMIALTSKQEGADHLHHFPLPDRTAPLADADCGHGALPQALDDFGFHASHARRSPSTKAWVFGDVITAAQSRGCHADSTRGCPQPNFQCIRPWSKWGIGISKDRGQTLIAPQS